MNTDKKMMNTDKNQGEKMGKVIRCLAAVIVLLSVVSVNAYAGWSRQDRPAFPEQFRKAFGPPDLKKSDNSIKQTGAIAGIVFEEHLGNVGAPLAGVTVSAVHMHGWTYNETVTDEFGNYLIDELAPGIYYIFSNLDGYGTDLKTDILVLPDGMPAFQDLFMSDNPGEIIGLVSIDGEPVADTDVHVSVLKESHNFYWINKQTRTTSDWGTNYIIEDLNPRIDYMVQPNPVEIDDRIYLPIYEDDVSVANGEATIVDFELQEGAFIYGVVSDGVNPVADTWIDCTTSEHLGNFGGWTDEEGHYEIYVLPGKTYHIYADPPNDTPYIIQRAEGIEIPVVDGYQVNFTLETGAITLEGRVVDADNPGGPGLAGIRVNYWNRDREIWAGTWTDAFGYYELFNLPRGEAELRIEPEHTYAATGRVEDFQFGTMRNFALDRESTISGLVVDAITGQVLPDVKLECTSGEFFQHKETRSDRDGWFEFRGLSQGITSIRAYPEVNSEEPVGYAWEHNYLYLGREENIDRYHVELDRGALIRGQVTNNIFGLPQEGVRIAANDKKGEHGVEAISDASGYYELRVVPGENVIHVENFDDDMEWVSDPQIIDVLDDSDDQDVDFMIFDHGMGRHIRGRVTNPGGYSMYGGSEIVIAALPEFTAEMMPDEFNLISPLSTTVLDDFFEYYELLVPLVGYYDVYFLLANNDRNREMESFTLRGALESIPGNTADVDFVYNSEGGTIFGRVTNDNGEGILMARVILFDANNYFAGFAQTDEAGNYYLYNVPAGDYTAEAMHPDYNYSTQGFGSVQDGGETFGVDIILSLLPFTPYIENITPQNGAHGAWVTIIGENFGEYTADADYHPEADFDNDGEINVGYDIQRLLSWNCWPYYSPDNPGYTNYKEDADVYPLGNPDGIINSYDIGQLLSWNCFYRDPMQTRYTKVIFSGTDMHGSSIGAKVFPENWSNTEITVKVPEGAETGPVTVITPKGESNTFMFTVSRGTIYVDASNPNDPLEDGSDEHPFDAIQEGLDIAERGDVVRVANGLYHERVEFNKNGVRLQAESRSAIIEGFGDSSVITCSNLNIIGQPSIIDNFTIRNGSYGIACSETNVSSMIIRNNDINMCSKPSHFGAAIFLDDNAGATVRDNYIHNCDKGVYGRLNNHVHIMDNEFNTGHDYYGGAVYFRNANTLIRDNYIHNSWDGAINLYQDSFAQVYNNRIVGNGGWVRSGGMNIQDSTVYLQNNIIKSNYINEGSESGGVTAFRSNLFVYNNVFSGNRGSIINTSYGAALKVTNCNLTAKNNIFAENAHAEETVFYGGGGEQYFSYNAFWENETDVLTNGLIWGPGLIFDEDPLFIDENEFRLGETSPCIDTGDPDQQFNDRDGSRNDMGVYGGPRTM